MTKTEQLLKKHNISHLVFEELLTSVIEGLQDNSVKIVADKVPYPVGYYRPEIGQKYHFLDQDGDIDWTEWSDDPCDHQRLSIGNVYETESQAEQALAQKQAYSELVQKIAELNHREGWKVSQYDTEENKGYFSYNHFREKIEMRITQNVAHVKQELIFKVELMNELFNSLTPEKIKLALWSIT